MSSSIDLERKGEGRYALDVRGQVCPYPELLTLRALHSLRPGDSLEVTLDNPPSARDIPLTLEKSGYDKTEISRPKRGTWKITIRV